MRVINFSEKKKKKKKKRKREKGIRASWNYGKCPVSFIRLDFSCAARGNQFFLRPLSLFLSQRFHRRNKSNPREPRCGVTATIYTNFLEKRWPVKIADHGTMEFIFFDRDEIRATDDKDTRLFILLSRNARDRIFEITNRELNSGKASFPKKLKLKKFP